MSSKITSKDGTPIAYERVGEGPAVILVDGALSFRGSSINGDLAKALAPDFTVYTYDRRGRGESGDTAPYAPERELEDLAALAALAAEAGGSVRLYGTSSGAALSLAAVENGLPVERLALYEPPFVVDGSRPAIDDDYVRRLDALVAADRRADAVKLFMREGVDLPAFVVAMMRFMPAWSTLKSVAHTLPYDTAFVAGHQRGKPYPEGEWGSVTVPTLVVDGGKSPKWMRNSVRSLAEALPSAGYRTLEGQTHIVKPEALAPVLKEFFQ